MHAGFHELLSLRDELPVDAAVAAHVRECARCGGELQRLRGVSSQLRALPPRWTPPGRWDGIAAALQSVPVRRAAGRRRQPGWRWPVAAAAAVAGTVAVIVWRGEQTSVPDESQARAVRLQSAADAAGHETGLQVPESDVAADAEHFMVRSYELEQALAALPAEPRLVRAGTALTLAELQDRIRWVDYRLVFGEQAGLQPRQTEQLWRERVDLLNSLVAVRYAQTRAPL